MDAYRDPELDIEHRTEDLLARMTIAEKAALMFHPSTSPDASSEEQPLAAAHRYAGELGISHFNVLGGEDCVAIAEWHNTLQEIAESTRLGIPVTLSSDPRHGLRSNLFTGEALGALSRWPDPLGIAATGALDQARAHGETVRKEFVAMGVRVLLGPMADIFSEPRWSRGSGTFGEDPEWVAALTVAFIEALRGSTRLGPSSVSAIVKHFPGAGPQRDGDDAHDPRYPDQVYPGDARDLHLRPFAHALAAGATQVMAYYGRPVGTDWPELGFAFNEPVLRGLLRQRLRFDGVVVTDWNVLEAETLPGGLQFGPNAWGLEHVTPLERAVAAIDAGVDQFGGDRNPQLVEEAVEAGLVSEARIDESVRRLLREKFRLGLFEHRRVDLDQTRAVCGAPLLVELGLRAQRRSLVLLTENAPQIATGAAVFLDGVDPEAAKQAGLLPVPSPTGADAIIVRLDTPFEPNRGSFGHFFHGGTLAFEQATIDRLRLYAARAPLFVAVHLERPAILAPFRDVASMLVCEFGASDSVILDAFLGRRPVTGTLPFDLPSSMAAVEASREDVPFDTANPLFRAGFGVRR